MSPYRSKAQMRYFHKNLPQYASQWDKETKNPKKLPNHVKPKKKAKNKKK